MRRRLFSLAVLVVALGLPAAATAEPLPAGWCHAQINVVGPGGQAHTLIYDRGRVQAVAPAALTLREADGSIVTIQVAASAAVRVNGVPAAFSQVQRGFEVTTFGIDGAPALRVEAKAPLRLVKPVLPDLRRGAAGPTP